MSAAAPNYHVFFGPAGQTTEEETRLPIPPAVSVWGFVVRQTCAGHLQAPGHGDRLTPLPFPTGSTEI